MPKIVPGYHITTSAQIRAIEQRAVDQGATWPGLMAEVAQAMADVALAIIAKQLQPAVLVLVGAGNNGGDALVIARHIKEAGYPISCYLYKRKPQADDWPFAAAQGEAIPLLFATNDPENQELQHLLRSSTFVIDGLFGIGLSRPLAADVAQIISLVNASKVPVLAVDVPSGLDADTGKIWGTIINASYTLAAGLTKRGHHLYPGAAYVGKLGIAAFTLPDSMEEPMTTTELNLATIRSLVPARPVDGHKDTFGRVMVVAGSYLYPGAAWLSATAAARSGAGVVTLACPRSIYGSTAAHLHEVTYLPLPEVEPGELTEAAAKLVHEKLAKYKALLVGPGLGTESGTGDFLRALIGLASSKRRLGVGFLGSNELEIPAKRKGGVGFGLAARPKEEAKAEEDGPIVLPPLVIDADGLNILATIENWQEKLRDQPVVLTPHIGEMARLLGEETLGEDHPQIALEAAARWGVTVVLKSAHTIIASPDGSLALHGLANPALATAGSGDILAGLTAGLLAQGLAPFEAAQLAVGVHGVAGALVREELGERGTIASDILNRLPLAWRKLTEGGKQ
ncbi:NAD(P)H-hydrate epimerase [Herpetosiphon giganteus]|uniref:NAD(P)H-hydrate epimerase n=1 Tax=Herpetosiphon giganteus TaxID=2029754 RepID=UPI00195C97D1|nr:NAD(P)H-hydrate epimerase [Herpetosiphon giganteus]MBM7844143.1 NAD(P)H-hydrate epimerase [Herpetosiphon giganteus]